MDWVNQSGQSSRVVGEEGVFWTEVAEEGKNPVAGKKYLTTLAVWKKLEGTNILKSYKNSLIPYHSLWLRLEVLCGQGLSFLLHLEPVSLGRLFHGRTHCISSGNFVVWFFSPVHSCSALKSFYVS